MRTTRRQFQLTAAASLPVLLGLTACGGGAPGTASDAAQEEADAASAELDGLSHEELVARATEEGQVTVYSFTSRIAQVEEEFEKTYPGIDLEQMIALMLEDMHAVDGIEWIALDF